MGSEWELVRWRDHFSHSQASMARRCLEQYRRRYILGEKERPSGKLIWGDAAHTGIEHDLRTRIETEHERGAPLDEVLTVAGETWDTRIEEAGGAEEIEWSSLVESGLRGNDLKRAANGVRERMFSLTSLYWDGVCPTLRPVAVEEEFRVEIEGLPLPLVGKIDVREADQLRDHKTTGSRESSIPGGWAAQGRTYQLVYPQPVVWDISVRTKKPVVVHAAFVQEPSEAIRKLTVEQLKQTMMTVEWCLREFGPEHPWPDATSSMNVCSWCGWGPKGANTCPWWNPTAKGD